ncbi:MAG TPA: class II aldolase/adducin family protein [Candidatus Dormibacteraeota bacterium]|nr:class II aldolase/adducin family protein [Candidatus Dormibacteraeota bacterium]
MAPRSPAPSEEIVLRAALIKAGRRLGARGLISAGEGNLSAQLADGTLFITPAGRRKDELDVDDVLGVPLAPAASADAAAKRGAGAASGPRPSSDIAIHRAIYAARPDARAVVHAHLPAAMALTLAGEVPDPAALPETALLLPRLPLVPFGMPGSAELAGRVAAAFVDGEEPLPGAVLLERHGAVAIGDNVDEAVNRLELVEVLCRTWRDALLIRGAVAADGVRSILRPSSPSPGTPARGRTRRQP